TTPLPPGRPVLRRPRRRRAMRVMTASWDVPPPGASSQYRAWSGSRNRGGPTHYGILGLQASGTQATGPPRLDGQTRGGERGASSPLRVAPYWLMLLDGNAPRRNRRGRQCHRVEDHPETPRRDREVAL